MHQEEIVEPRECASCGAIEGLLKCSQCHSAYFCSTKCQRAYWPFHRAQCYRNEFADIVEQQEPKFARWMRKHRKLAVLKDDEVDRLERASQSSTGYSREEVMDSMYNRLQPRPKASTYSGEEMIKMRHRQETDLLQARKTTTRDKAWLQISVPANLGLDCGAYKWFQDQVEVDLHPKRLRISLDSHAVLDGELYREIICGEETTWFIEGGLLEVVMAKRNRRGNYQKGTTNLDTFWRSVLTLAPESETLALTQPPATYYTSWYEGQEEEAQARLQWQARQTLALQDCQQSKPPAPQKLSSESQ